MAVPPHSTAPQSHQNINRAPWMTKVATLSVFSRPTSSPPNQIPNFGPLKSLKRRIGGEGHSILDGEPIKARETKSVGLAVPFCTGTGRLWAGPRDDFNLRMRHFNQKVFVLSAQNGTGVSMRTVHCAGSHPPHPLCRPARPLPQSHGLVAI